ncbi:unnamed protein product [Sphagnum jensenii]|uniref:Uncharacterized protein n=1 Tax=Sphagnum jensenii TaxID=128206 RepID=A0ABP0V7B1_9BRYO
MAAPLIEEVVTLVGGSTVGDAVTLVINRIEADFLTVSTVISNVVNTPSATELQTIVNALNSIKSSLPELLAVVNVSNPATLTSIESNVTLLINEAEALLGVFQTVTAVATPAIQTPATPAIQTPASPTIQTAPEAVQLTGTVKREQL